MERSTPEKNPQPSNEPIEPFIEESISFEEKTTVTFDALKPPSSPLTKEKLKIFILDLQPIILGITFLKHPEKEKLGKWLQAISKKLPKTKLNQAVQKGYKEFVDLYERYLTYPTPFDQKTLLDKLSALAKLLR